MKKKVILLSTFLLVFVLGLFSISYGVTATSFNGTGQQIFENTWDAGFISANSILGNENAYSQYLDIIDDMSYYPCVVISLENQSFYPRKIYTIYCGNSYTSQSNIPNGSFTISSQVKYVATIGNSGWVSSQSSYSNFTTNQTFNVSSPTQYRAYYWLYNGVWYQSLGSWYSTDYDLNNLRVDLDWEYTSGYQTTSVSGFSSTFYGYNRDYGVRFWDIGTLSNYDDFPILNFKFYKIYSPLEQELVIDTNLYKSSFGWGTNNGTIALTTSGKVSVLSRNLTYSPYYMVIYALDDDLNVLSSCDGYFIFRQIGSTIPSTIGSGDYNGSGDYSNQNSTNDIIDTITNIPTDDELNVSINDFPTFEVGDPTINFFEYLLDRFSNVFLNNQEVNLTITIPYLMNNDYILSSDFFILQGPLLLFIQTFCLVWFVVPKLNDIHEIIKAMQMGYSDAFIRYFGYGISINDLL